MAEIKARTKLMITAALNSQLQEKKLTLKHLQPRCSKDDDDPDYQVSETDMELSSESDTEVRPTSVIPENLSEGDASIELSVKSVIEKILDVVTDEFTARGTKRKRKKYKISLPERNRLKRMAIVNKHAVKLPCKETCKRKCILKIPAERRLKINEEFWKMNSKEQKTYMFNKMKKNPVKRRTKQGLDMRRNFTINYFCPNDDGEDQAVCKTFFLATLGYKPKGDKRFRNILEHTSRDSLQAERDRRGQAPTNKIDTSLIKEHINSFEPTIAHYRRAHAPNRKYLPTDLNVTMMYNDFKIKHPTFKCSYELYRRTVQEMNISFVKLGHEECFSCEAFFLHEKESNHKRDELNDCLECKEYKIHKKKSMEARENYTKDKNEKADGTLIYSADLQKVISWQFILIQGGEKKFALTYICPKILFPETMLKFI